MDEDTKLVDCLNYPMHNIAIFEYSRNLICFDGSIDGKVFGDKVGQKSMRKEFVVLEELADGGVTTRMLKNYVCDPREYWWPRSHFIVLEWIHILAVLLYLFRSQISNMFFGNSLPFFVIYIGHEFHDCMAYQTQRAWINLNIVLINFINGVCILMLFLQQVDVSSTLLVVHIPFSTSSPRVKIFHFQGFFFSGIYTLG